MIKFAHATLAIACAAATAGAPPVHAHALVPATDTAVAPMIAEWGRPVAPGAPGLLPAAVQNGAAQIDAGNYTDVLVAADGTVWAWGGASMALSQVAGVGNVVQRPVDGNGNFLALEQPGTDPACPTSSTVVRWGIKKPVGSVEKALQCQNVVQVAAAATHFYALTADGRVFVWGSSGTGALGMGPGITSLKNPTLNPTLSALTGGTSQGVLLTTGMSSGTILVNGQAYAWGGNAQSQCGCGQSGGILWTPLPVVQTVAFVFIDQGGNYNDNGHTLALDAAGNVYAWGDGVDGQLGQGVAANSDVPLFVPGLPPIVDVRAGGMHSLALDASGNVYAWGCNLYGQIGDGTTNNVLSPELVLQGASMISAGSLHSLAQ